MSRFVGKAVPARCKKRWFRVNVDTVKLLQIVFQNISLLVSKASNLDENDFVCRFLVS